MFKNIIKISSILCVLTVNANSSDKWWESLNGIEITSYEHFKTLVSSPELENAHIMIEFYMEQCRYCLGIKDDWNGLVEDTSAKYNHDNNVKTVEFFKINGEKLHELRRRYRINGFPNFIYLRPGTKGREAKQFDG